LLSRRDALTVEERRTGSQAIADRVHGTIHGLAPGQVIALYAAKGSEVDPLHIDDDARAHGLIVVYPRIAESRALAFHAVDRDDLVPARFGLREPRADAPAVDLASIAAFIVPGLAFDREGGRMGWGMGHYDATFAAASTEALRIGLAFDCQIVERVPREPHDQMLHMIVTEVATYTVA
jgi:5-formyltetrahydrofolate cyclo-ligase